MAGRAVPLGQLRRRLEQGARDAAAAGVAPDEEARHQPHPVVLAGVAVSAASVTCSMPGRTADRGPSRAPADRLAVAVGEQAHRLAGRSRRAPRTRSRLTSPQPAWHSFTGHEEPHAVAAGGRLVRAEERVEVAEPVGRAAAVHGRLRGGRHARRLGPCRRQSGARSPTSRAMQHIWWSNQARRSSITSLSRPNTSKLTAPNSSVQAIMPRAMTAGGRPGTDPARRRRSISPPHAAGRAARRSAVRSTPARVAVGQDRAQDDGHPARRVRPCPAARRSPAPGCRRSARTRAGGPAPSRARRGRWRRSGRRRSPRSTRGLGRLDRRAHGVVGVDDQRGQQVVAAGEVAVDGRRHHARSPGPRPAATGSAPPRAARCRRAVALISSVISARTRARSDAAGHPVPPCRKYRTQARALLLTESGALRAMVAIERALLSIRISDLEVTMALHVIVGAGPVGSSAAAHLTAAGHQVRVVTRSGDRPAASPAVERVAADATDADRLDRARRGARRAVYNCANPPYHRWPRDWPPLAAALLAAAERTGAVLVTMGNLYGYGPVDGPMTQDLPLRPTTVKGRVRAQMWRDALAAHEAGRIRAAEARASDFVGPGRQVGLQRDGAAQGAGRPRRPRAGELRRAAQPDLHRRRWPDAGHARHRRASLGSGLARADRAGHHPAGRRTAVRDPRRRAGPAPARDVGLRCCVSVDSSTRARAAFIEMRYQFLRPFVLDSSADRADLRAQADRPRRRAALDGLTPASPDSDTRGRPSKSTTE